MFYVYMIGSVIVSLVLIGLACSTPIFILKEFDKMTYIRGYKQNLKWYKLPLLYVRNLVIFVFYILSFGWLSIFVLYQQIDKYYLLKKQSYVVYSSMFVTPLVGIGLTYVLVNGIVVTLYYLELHAISLVFNVICSVLPYLVVTYYLILIFKQLRNIYSAENQQIAEQYNEFCHQDKKELVKLILSSSRKDQYVDDYLLLYNSVEEWKSSEFNILNYNYFCLLLFKLFSIVTIVNCVVFFIVGTVYGSGDYALIQVRSSMMMSIILSGSTIIILLLSWLFNKDIIFSLKNNEKLSKKALYKLILSLVIGTIGMLVLINSIRSNLYMYDSEYNITFNYNDFKSDIVHKVEVNRDYLNYDDYDKLDYIFRYPQYFLDDVESLKYEYYFNGDNQDVTLYIYVPAKNPQLIACANSYFDGSYSYMLLITYNIQHYTRIFFDDNANKDEKNFVRVYLNEKNHQYPGEEFKTEEEAKLGKLMKEEVLQTIDNLWNEEMKDKGLI